MSVRSLRAALMLSILSLTACAQQSGLQQIQHEISALNKDMVALSQQAVTLSEQNALNAQSTQGVYLLPNSGAAALLESKIGVLKMSLTDIAPSPTGSKVTLVIQENQQQNLPAFSGVVEWQIGSNNSDSASETASGQISFNAPVALATPGEAKVSLNLPGVPPENLRWVRVHDINPLVPPPITR